MTTCGNCGSTEIRCVDSEGAVMSGPFTEEYECQQCGATGTISGRAEDTGDEWERSGEVFA